MKKSLFQKLLKIARAVVEQVKNSVTQQLNVVEEQVQRQLEAYIREVVGGVWTGNGADRFVATITEEALPALSQLTAAVTQTQRNIQTAVQILDEADMNVRSAVENLASKFESI
jgi:hypothetical protein